MGRDYREEPSYEQQVLWFHDGLVDIVHSVASDMTDEDGNPFFHLLKTHKIKYGANKVREDGEPHERLEVDVWGAHRINGVPYAFDIEVKGSNSNFSRLCTARQRTLFYDYQMEKGRQGLFIAGNYLNGEQNTMRFRYKPPVGWRNDPYAVQIAMKVVHHLNVHVPKRMAEVGIIKPEQPTLDYVVNE